MGLPCSFGKKKMAQLERFCVDYRKLNTITIKDSYTIPRIDDMLNRLDGNSWFSSLDLKSSYWQVKIHAENKEKQHFQLEKMAIYCYVF